MFRMFQMFWESFLAPLLQRPRHLQMAALCHRDMGKGREYLLVTSRDTARWIIPKGWPIRGLNAGETALREAWEEAGVKNSPVTSKPIGSYTYNKRRAGGLEVPVETLVYSVQVEDLSDDFPEARQRKRKWVTAETAAKLVNEAELKSLFRAQKAAAS